MANPDPPAPTDLPVAQVTARLLLRPWRPDDPSDVDAAFALYSDPLVSRFLGATPAPVPDREAARDKLVRYDSWSDGVHGVFAVVPFGGADVPVGSALLLPLPRSDGQESDAREVGWHLRPDVWGRGFATEAGRAMLQRARAAGLDEAHAVVYPENDASLAVCDRLGMTRIGATDGWYGVELVDHVVPLTVDLRQPAAASANAW
jgi:RimJ/RimL family protein N-acetyltransferase